MIPYMQGARDEPRPGEHLEGLRVDEVVAGFASLANRSGRLGNAAHEAGTQIVTAFGSTATLNDLTFVRSPPSSS